MVVTNEIFQTASLMGSILDFVGVLIIVVGVIVATVLFIIDWLQHKEAKAQDLYRSFRQNLGRAILLGLEILVAGDIIRSVAGTPTLMSVTVLAILVLIRTFLGIAFEMEVDGRWPWERKK